MAKAKAEFLMLAHNFVFGKHKVGGWFYSEKLDGIRCFWDGGISRGLFCSNVPFANTTKHDRFVEAPVATGLWTRYGQPLHAPNWWLDQLPKVPLDGELTVGRNSWQKTTSIVKSLGSNQWDVVKYLVFDSPPFEVVFKDRYVNNTNMKKMLTGCVDWAAARAIITNCANGHTGMFGGLRRFLGRFDFGPSVEIHLQTELSASSRLSEIEIKNALVKVEALGGEGLMLRPPTSTWEPRRSWDLLKVKSLKDMEGTVTGYKFGKPTDVERNVSGLTTNKLVGLMGSLVLRLDDGITFDLSGFTEAERELFWLKDRTSAREYVTAHCGEEAPEEIGSILFPRGSRLTFKYRELSTSGVPKEARYWRRNV